MDETKMRGDFDSSPFASQVNTHHHLKRAWKSDSGARKKRKPCPKLQIQQQIFMPAIVENYFVVFIRLETGDSTFCQPAVRRPSTDNKRSIQGFNLSLNVEQ